MANKKSSKSKGDNPGSLLIALLVIASVLALFFYSSGVNMGNLFNTVRYHAADIGPRLVECVTSPESCKLNSNYNVTPSGYETNSTTNSNYNSKQPQQQNNTNDNNEKYLLQILETLNLSDILKVDKLENDNSLLLTANTIPTIAKNLTQILLIYINNI